MKKSSGLFDDELEVDSGYSDDSGLFDNSLTDILTSQYKKSLNEDYEKKEKDSE